MSSKGATAALDPPQMKVAIVTSFPENPEAPSGGVEAVSVNLVRALPDIPGLDIHVVTLDENIGDIVVSERRGVTIHRLPRSKSGELLNAIGLGRRRLHSYLLAMAPDIIHAHDTYGIMVKGLPIPRVFTIHGFIYGDTLVSGRRWPWLRSKIWKIVETSAWADQPHIISISPYVREHLAGICTGIIHDIDNPVAGRFFDIQRTEEKGVIFSAAVISPRKNTIGLIKAFEMLLNNGHDARLRIAGAVVEPVYGRAVEGMIRERRLQDHVTLLGKIGSAQVLDELARATVFALVSLEENSPMGIEEAMAAGVPVVTSNRCGMPYMVRHGESGYLVDPHSPSDIARRLAMIIGDDGLRFGMGARAKEMALDRFHPALVARRTACVYYDAVGNGCLAAP